jgi:2-oxoacid:acceptor oxidoreductase gamma subunit (pyruvate/2-ketoisovalerate family)
VVVLDESLLASVNVFDGLKENGIVIINSEKPIKAPKGVSVFYVNATKIANDILGKPIVNTSMLGALIKATGIVSIESLDKALEKRFTGAMLEKNLKAIQKTYGECSKC